MIRLTILALCVLLLTSCSIDRGGYQTVRRFHRTVKVRDLRDFRSIEIFKRGDEFWGLPVDSTNAIFYVWDSTKREFSKNGVALDRSTQSRLCSLRSRKEELGILEISQSPWRGEFVKFRFTQRDVAIYLSPSYPLDSEAKQIWKREFDRGIRMDSAWAYYNIEWAQISNRDLAQRKAQLTNDDH